MSSSSTTGCQPLSNIRSRMYYFQEDWYIHTSNLFFSLFSTFRHTNKLFKSSFIYLLGILFSAVLTTSCHRHLEATIMFGKGMNCLCESLCCSWLEDRQLNRKRASIFSIKFQNWMMCWYMNQFIYSVQLQVYSNISLIIMTFSNNIMV